MVTETFAENDIGSDAFVSYFSGCDPNTLPKVLIKTWSKATNVTHDFCEELKDVIPRAGPARRKEGRGFEIGRITRWAADRCWS